MKRTPLRLTLICTSLLFGLSGCSTISSWIAPKKIDYQSAKQIPSLEVPPDLTTPTADAHYQVPANGAPASVTYSAYSAAQANKAETPATTTESQNGAAADTVLPGVDNIKLDRAGSERWLVVNQSPDKLWPLLTAFWQNNGYTLVQNNPTTGIMETDWKENRSKIPQDIVRKTLGKLFDGLYSSGERDKYRTRIERNPTNPNQTEVYISHQGMTEVYDTADSHHTVWQYMPPDPELEAEMLSRLMVSLGETQAHATAMLADANGTARAKIVQSANGVSTLVDDEPFDRAWRRVGLALDRVGYTVVDRDRSKGIYFVRNANQPQNGGMIAGIFNKLEFWHDSDYNQQYQIALANNPQASSTEIQVLDTTGKPAKTAIVAKINKLLLEQLK